MARRSFDPWAKKSKAGMKTLSKILDFGIKLGKAAAKPSPHKTGAKKAHKI